MSFVTINTICYTHQILEANQGWFSMLKIEIWSDLNCPFCYIGKRYLEAAIKNLTSTQSNNIFIEWKSFELDRESQPPKGTSSIDLLAKKYGKDRSWAIQMNADMTEMALDAGLDFHLDKAIAANSFNAHRLIHLAKTRSLQDELVEKLFSYKFIEGKDIGETAILREASLGVGLSLEEIQTVLESDKFGQDVRKDEDQAGALGIRGVPYFVFNKERTISGAQPVEIFTSMIEQSLRFVASDLIQF
jgi:predicted DsbA family dithiol-disulfide isomerase